MPLDATNSYITVAEADTIAADELYVGDWSLIDDAIKAKRLIRATEILNSWKYLGMKVDTNQDHEFPRKGLTDDLARYNDTTPNSVNIATFRMAVYLSENDPDQNDIGNKEEIWFNDIKVKLRSGGTSVAPSSVANLLGPFLAHFGQVTVHRG